MTLGTFVVAPCPLKSANIVTPLHNAKKLVQSRGRIQYYSWRAIACDLSANSNENMESADTELLLERARRGDGQALEDLLGRYRERLRLAIGLRLDQRLKARVDISDALQETCLEATRRFDDYLQAPQLPFELWLRWLAHEQVLMLHRKHLYADKRDVRREVPPLPADASSAVLNAVMSREPAPSHAVHAADLADKVRIALGRLDEDERDLILWRHFEQLPNGAIAQLLGISEPASAKRYLRALERLHKILLDLGVSGPC
jgi:RNA polymerase sigma-70 factor (ECF subfamily)